MPLPSPSEIRDAYRRDGFVVVLFHHIRYSGDFCIHRTHRIVVHEHVCKKIDLEIEGRFYIVGVI